MVLPAADGDTTLLWYDEELMKELTDVDLFGDGTYATRPKIEMKRSSQFFTIMTKINGKVRKYKYLFEYNLFDKKCYLFN